MIEPLLNDLPLPEKAAWIEKNGLFLEAQDYYSFFVHIYQLNKDHIKLLYDFSGSLISIEYSEDAGKDNFLSSQLESTL